MCILTQIPSAFWDQITDFKADHEEIDRQPGSLCECIERCLGTDSMRLDLLARTCKVETGSACKLFIHGITPTKKIWDIKQHSQSLFDLLRTYVGTPMPFEMKQSLSIRLAKAVWECYTTPLMQNPWTKHDVHFILETRGEETGVFVDEPLLAITIPPHPVPDVPTKREYTHRIPKILGLGIMLMEIWLGRPIEEFCGNNANDQMRFLACLRLIDAKESFDRLGISESVEILIKDCFLHWRETFLSEKHRTENEIRNQLGVSVSRLMFHLKEIKYFGPVPAVNPSPINSLQCAEGPFPSRNRVGTFSSYDSKIRSELMERAETMAYQ